MPQLLKATYQIVTPLFLGDVNHDPDDGIRPPSFKGMLRFWWRALNWSLYMEQSNNNEIAALKLLHQEEARLFGHSMEGDEGGQGCFLLSMTMPNHIKKTSKGEIHPEFKKSDAARYLGYGVMESFASRVTGAEAGQLIRGCINENQSFTVKLLFKKNIEPSVQEALMALGLLGGLGSRTRRGLGSITLEKITQSTVEDEETEKTLFEKATTAEAYQQQIQALLNGKLSAPNPAPYTCFDDQSRIDYFDRKSNPYQVLNTFATKFMMYRKEEFNADHDWFNGDFPRGFHPERVVFGLPHDYSKTIKVKGQTVERRSSPLFLHVHQLDDHTFIGIMIFLPTLFLPNGEKINAGRECVPQKADYDKIREFLTKYRFPNLVSITKGVNG